MVERLGWVKRPHGNVGQPGEVGWQFNAGVTAKCNPAPRQHRGEITVLKQHVRSRRPDALLANHRIIVRRRKENRASNSTRNVFNAKKVNTPSLKHSVHSRGFTPLTSDRTPATCVACSSASLL